MLKVFTKGKYEKRLGKVIKIPVRIIKIPEKYCQKFAPKVKNKVLDLINKVKTTIEINKDKMTLTPL
jgi:hypothetical protein